MANQDKIAVEIESIEFKEKLLSLLRSNGWDIASAKPVTLGGFISIPGPYDVDKSASSGGSLSTYTSRGYEILTEKDWDRIVEVVTGKKKEKTNTVPLEITLTIQKELEIPEWAIEIVIYQNGEVYANSEWEKSGMFGRSRNTYPIGNVGGTLPNIQRYKVNKNPTLEHIETID